MNKFLLVLIVVLGKVSGASAGEVMHCSGYMYSFDQKGYWKKDVSLANSAADPTMSVPVYVFEDSKYSVRTQRIDRFNPSTQKLEGVFHITLSSSDGREIFRTSVKTDSDIQVTLQNPLVHIDCTP